MKRSTRWRATLAAAAALVFATLFVSSPAHATWTAFWDGNAYANTWKQDLYSNSSGGSVYHTFVAVNATVWIRDSRGEATGITGATYTHSPRSGQYRCKWDNPAWRDTQYRMICEKNV